MKGSDRLPGVLATSKLAGTGNEPHPSWLAWAYLLYPPMLSPILMPTLIAQEPRGVPAVLSLSGFAGHVVPSLLFASQLILFSKEWGIYDRSYTGNLAAINYLGLTNVNGKVIASPAGSAYGIAMLSSSDAGFYWPVCVSWSACEKKSSIFFGLTQLVKLLCREGYSVRCSFKALGLPVALIISGLIVI